MKHQSQAVSSCCAGNCKPLGMGAEVWLGFSQSLRACATGLTLNVDVASTAFVSAQPMVEYVARAAGVRPDLINQGLSGNQLRAATKAALKLQARSSPPPSPPLPPPRSD